MWQGFSDLKVARRRLPNGTGRSAGLPDHLGISLRQRCDSGGRRRILRTMAALYPPWPRARTTFRVWCGLMAVGPRLAGGGLDGCYPGASKLALHSDLHGTWHDRIDSIRVW